MQREERGLPDDAAAFADGLDALFKKPGGIKRVFDALPSQPLPPTQSEALKQRLDASIDRFIARVDPRGVERMGSERRQLTNNIRRDFAGWRVVREGTLRSERRPAEEIEAFRAITLTDIAARARELVEEAKQATAEFAVGTSAYKMAKERLDIATKRLELLEPAADPD